MVDNHMDIKIEETISAEIPQEFTNVQEPVKNEIHESIEDVKIIDTNESSKVYSEAINATDEKLDSNENKSLKDEKNEIDVNTHEPEIVISDLNQDVLKQAHLEQEDIKTNPEISSKLIIESDEPKIIQDDNQLNEEENISELKPEPSDKENELKIQNEKEAETETHVEKESIEVIDDVLLTETLNDKEEIVIIQEKDNDVLIKEEKESETLPNQEDNINLETEETKLEQEHMEEPKIDPEIERVNQFFSQLEFITKEMDKQKTLGNQFNKSDFFVNEENRKKFDEDINKAIDCYYLGIQQGKFLFSQITPFIKDHPSVQSFLNTFKLLYSNTSLAFQRLRKYEESISHDNFVYIF